MDLNEIKKELDYLNEVNSLKDMQQYEKLISVYSIKKEEPILMILKDKIYYLHQNILTDDLGFIKGRVEDDTILWLNEEDF
jgi:hypothetical protein